MSEADLLNHWVRTVIMVISIAVACMYLGEKLDILITKTHEHHIFLGIQEKDYHDQCD